MFALRLLSEGGEGPNIELLWLLYIGIALFFLVIIVGWMTGGREQEQSEAAHEASMSKVGNESDERTQQKEIKAGRKR